MDKANLERLTLNPITHVSGEINLPGSKSVSNRALLLAALSHGKTQLTNLLDSDDIRHMLSAFDQLGVQYQLSEDKSQCCVSGNPDILIQNQALTFFLGNAGTAMRPLTAALCAGKGTFTLTGEPRMKERPIGHLVEALRQLGAQINYLENENYPPLEIQAKGLRGGEVIIDGSISSQFLTALLMAAPFAQTDMSIKIKGELVSKPYIRITLDIMKSFGVEVEQDDYQSFYIRSGQSYVSPGDFLVEGDASSASYFLAAAAIRGGRIKVTGIGHNSIQGDIHFADALEQMGAKITWGENFIQCDKNELMGIDMDLNHIPDAAMTIATTALFAKGETCIRNIYNWRVKETDRLSAMATELRKVGAKVEEGEDFICIQPPQKFNHAQIETYDDHRMAMCFSLVALSDSAVTILDPKCTSKTFPNYFDAFLSLTD